MIDSDDEEQPSKSATQQQQYAVSQTQPDVTTLVSEIFGESDDDEEVPTKQPTLSFSDSENSADDRNALIDSSDDDAGGNGWNSRLSKGTKTIVRRKHANDEDGEDYFSSDRQSKKRKKGKDDEKKKKREREQRHESREGSSRRKVAKSSASQKSGKSGGNSGDEYDSGEDAQANAEDENFIDRDDDQEEVVREYDEDNQNFDDENPNKGKPGKKTLKSSDSSSSRQTKKESDPLSQTLDLMKRTKAVEMTEVEKARIATALMEKMDRAAQLDEECYRVGEPAVHKLKMLPTMEQIVSIKALQDTLLEYDILSVLKLWIDPKDSKTLPALAVRTAVYKVLLALPCQTDQLKRAAPGKQPIGTTIVSLRKHAMETEENKRLLKSIMEKWSRPIFAKTVDPRGANKLGNAELREAVLQRQLSSRSDEGGLSAKTAGRLDALLAASGASSATTATNSQRARCPISSGFLFTVKPEYKKKVDKIGPGECEVAPEKRPSKAPINNLGETRNKIMKTIKDNKPPPPTLRGASVGKKANVRAVTLSLTGRNKA